MKPRELEAERIRAGKTRMDIAIAMGVTAATYLHKEKGHQKFYPDQIVTVSRELGLNADQINLIFFDGQLPIGKRKTYKRNR